MTGAFEVADSSGLDHRDDRSDRRVIGVHPIEQVAGARVLHPYERPEPTILGAVVLVEKVHHPDNVVVRDADAKMLLISVNLIDGGVCAFFHEGTAAKLHRRYS